MTTKIALLLLFSLFLSPFAYAQTTEILNQARKEGEVVLYTTMTVGDF